MNKVDIGNRVRDFDGEVDAILDFIRRVKKAHRMRGTNLRLTLFGLRDEAFPLNDTDLEWCYNYAIIRLFDVFENFMLNCIICALNNKADTSASNSEPAPPLHMNVAACKERILRKRYFTFSGGRKGLLKKILQYVKEEDHWLPQTVGKECYTEALDRLITLRNYAAHSEPMAKREACDAVGHITKLPTSGYWLKGEDRFRDLCFVLLQMACELEGAERNAWKQRLPSPRVKRSDIRKLFFPRDLLRRFSDKWHR